MGTILHLVDRAGKHALEIDKCRWLPWGGPVNVAFITEQARESPDTGAREHWWPKPATLIRWLTEVAEGRDCDVQAPEHDDRLPPGDTDAGWTEDRVDGPDGWRRFECGKFIRANGNVEWPPAPPRVPRLVECPRTAGGVEGFDPLPPDDDVLRGWTATEWRVLVGRP